MTAHINCKRRVALNSMVLASLLPLSLPSLTQAAAGKKKNEKSYCFNTYTVYQVLEKAVSMEIAFQR